MAKVTFNNKNNTFYQALKSSVDDYFSQQQLRKTGNWKLYIKTAVLVPGVLVIYLLLLLLPVPLIPGILLSLLLGFLLACIGFNVMHDACHGSYSPSEGVNNLMGLTLNALGGNAFIWKFKHNIIHHTYTNVDGIDDDIAKSPLLRHCTTQKWVPMHRYQHIYIVLVYAISSFAWVFFLDFIKYFQQKVQHTPLQKMSRREHLIFWLSKLLYVVFYIVIPVLMTGWLPWLIGFSAMHIALGFTLAIVFQLAHAVEETDFVYVGEHDTRRIENEWAIHQVNTTSNFAPRNKIISWFVGGLNYQVEHHLFPRISHIHYPAINRIVKQNCAAFGIVYHEFPTMRHAIASHFRLMRQLGRKS